MSGGVPFPVYFWSIGRTFSLRFRNIMLSDGGPVQDNWISLTSRRSCKVSALMVTHIPTFLGKALFFHTREQVMEEMNFPFFHNISRRLSKLSCIFAWISFVAASPKKFNSSCSQKLSLVCLCILISTRPGVQQCQAQGLVFCSWLGLIQDRTRMCKINKSEFFSLNM